MPVRPNFNPDYLYFITPTTLNHLHLFTEEDVKRILVDSLLFLHAAQRMELYAFVIMPNHIHFIARFPGKHKMGDIMRDFKRHTARHILLRLHAKSDAFTLTILDKAVNEPGQDYKVWEDGYDARDIFSLEFLQQKMEYIHWNPCRPKWNLANLPEDYPWSSAIFI